jgi:hypothetical protein
MQIELNRENVVGCLLIAVALFVVIPIIAFILGLGPWLGGLNLEYSSGFRAGQVTKFSQRGYVFKTWEGELNIGGFTASGDGSYAPNIFRFSVRDPIIVNEVNKALESGKRIKLTYRQVWVRNAYAADTDYYIIGVEAADGPAAPQPQPQPEAAK